MSIEDFERAWPYLEPAVLRARQYSKEAVRNVIETGQARLWMLPNSVAVSMLRTFPSGRKSFGFWLAGGELGELVDLAHGEALQSALTDQCNEMRVLCGRRGWVRALGWRDVGVTAVLDLDNA